MLVWIAFLHNTPCLGQAQSMKVGRKKGAVTAAKRLCTATRCYICLGIMAWCLDGL